MDAMTALHTDITRAYDAWKDGRAVKTTRAGARYAAHDVARLVAPPLARLGLRVFFAPDRGDSGEELLVTAAGRHLTRRRVAELLGRALEGFEDATLRASAQSPHTLRELLSLLPSADAAPTAYDRSPAGRPAVAAPARDHFDRFVVEGLQPEEGTRAAFLRYLEDADAEGVAAMGSHAFHRAMRASGAVEQRHTRRGNVYRKI